MNILEIQNLEKKFGGISAVSNCSLNIEQGTITGLIGPNGAGKSTLFNLVAGALRPDKGNIVFENKDITGVPAHQLFHSGIVRTFQIPHEFQNLTVLDNLIVAAGNTPGENLLRAWIQPLAIREIEKKILLKAEEVVTFLKLSKVANDEAGTLSGGQKKLLELGRAMMSQPKMILLDEPGAGVNPTLLKELSEMIKSLHKNFGYTICIIEHNMDMIAELCDPVIVMAEGKVLTEGNMETVRKNKEVLDAYLGGSQ